MRQSEDQPWRIIIDTVPTLVWSTRPDGSAEFFNQGWLDYTGLSPEQALGWGWKVAIHPDDLYPILEKFEKTLNSGQSFDVEGRLRRFDGEFRWFLFRGRPLLDELGRVTKWYGTNTDIEDRKRAEEALRAAASERKRLTAVRAEVGMALTRKDNLKGILDICAKTMVRHLDAAFARIWTLNGDGRELELQASAGMYTRLDGRYSRIRFGELKIGLIAQERRPHLTNDVQNDPRIDDKSWAKAEKMTSFAGYPLIVEDHIVGVMAMFSQTLLTQSTIETLSFVADGIAQGIERKRAEEALRATEQSSRQVVDSIPGLVSSLTAAGELEFVNQQMLDYSGKTLEELKGWANSDVVHSEDLPRVIASWKRSVETGQPDEMELRLRRADGAHRWFYMRRIPLRGTEDHILRWYTLCTDIDDRKKAEEKLRRSEWDLLEAQRLGHSGSWHLDVASGLVKSSPEMIRVFDVKPDEDYLKPDFWFGRIHPEDRKRVRDLFEKCMMEKADYEASFRLLLPDGTIKYQYSCGCPILNEAGDLVEFAGTAIDTTEQVQARLSLEKALTEVKLLRDQLDKENQALRDEVDRVSMFEEIVGTSQALQSVLSRVMKVAPTDSSVLITGETGTGKELIARAIHKRSLRSQRAFVSVNCAALAPTLISSELFGHERGAFTGALQRQLGRFELANGGTIFLDEVGELPADTQAALLRVLQEREFERVGGKQPISIDVRVIAATNRNLEAAIANRTFRSDLFYRLNVFPIEVPPLRERKQDVLMLLEYFVHRFARKVGKNFRRIDKRTLELFRSYDWPGNIRELQNVVERSVIVSPDGVFCVDEAWLSTKASGVHRQGASESIDGVAVRQRQIIEAALKASRGRVYGPKGAAAQLRIPPSTLDSKIKKLKICKSDFKLV